MTSSRLPGKVILPADGKPLLCHLIERLKVAESINEIVLATTVNKSDDCLAELADREQVSCFRGSEEDVLGRVVGAADSTAADIVVAVTGDCPIIDPLIVEQNIRMFLNNPCDYLGNGHIPSYPIGMGSQIVRAETLRRVWEMTSDPLDHEHTTLFIRRHPELFSHFYLIAPPDHHWPDLRLTLDEEADYRLIKRIIEYFGSDHPFFSCREVIQLLKSKPDWVAINKMVRKTVIPKLNHKRE